ncbi:DUF6446 family protein [Sedimentitalea nanhaiensis]|uniref:Histidine kinase n=1 Tax=Sedimentitalea nanhaiensis TaxID=999627 RepID=A0A1I6YDN8_9RHOB|nr:DUF6446 family protein [Sedimentitalea nanhaiensis]SFT48613.1 hypothetical protein SAMN05216236_102161 [Sedimentitalea nanhaiensis]
MMGKVLAVALLVCGLIAGGAMYYLQVYGYYHEVAASGPEDVAIVSLATDAPEPIPHSGFRAIDADSSPIRYRACFDTTADPAALSQTYWDIAGADPRNAPGWFDCFDAAAIAAQIQNGSARVFMGQKNVHYGVDRIVVITDDGRGFAWNELNDCGAKAYDGTVVGEECPQPEHDPGS